MNLSPRLRWVALGFGAAMVVIALGALGVIEGGVYNATAIQPHDPLSGWATHTTMTRYFQRHALGVAAPARFSATQITAGLRDYQASCVECHGGPAVARARWTSGITPSPPYLLDASRHWSSSELFLIIKEGVKMTAMPAWGLSRSDAQIWDLVAFLEAAPDLAPSAYARMAVAPQPSRPTSRSSAPPS